MTDKFSPQDEDIIRRLRSFKNAGSDYPADVLEKRRASFQNAAMGLVGAVPAAGFVKGLRHYLPHTSEAALQVILVSALLIEAGLGAYLYRDQIQNWLASEMGRPTVTLSSHTPPPTLSSTATLTLSSRTSNLTLTSTATLTPTPTATTTPTPLPMAPATPTPLPMAPATATPIPTATATIPTQTPHPTNPGHHYGQTQTPRPP